MYACIMLCVIVCSFSMTRVDVIVLWHMADGQQMTCTCVRAHANMHTRTHAGATYAGTRRCTQAHAGARMHAHAHSRTLESTRARTDGQQTRCWNAASALQRCAASSKVWRASGQLSA